MAGIVGDVAAGGEYLASAMQALELGISTAGVSQLRVELHACNMKYAFCILVL